MGKRLAKRVLLIGWDAADWRLITPLLDDGKLPNLERLIDTGVMGNMATLSPCLSPMLWTSIATGKRADQHGILSFVEPASDGEGIRPISGASRRVKALWNILMHDGLKSNVVGWWPSHPAEPIDGAMVSNRFHHATAKLGEPWPLPPGAVHPERLAETLSQLRMHPAECDECILRMFVPDAHKVDQEKDRSLATLAKLVADTTSVHGAATWLMENEPWDFMAVYYDAIDHFSHAFMSYHPPRRPHVQEEAFELYKEVVTNAYRYHDLLLGRLMQLAGEETTILLVSDHGFESGGLRPMLPRGFGRPGPAAWHRPYGIFAMRGPGIKKDERVYGASLLDVAPTVLSLFGLPVGADMEGQCLAQAFEEPPELERIPSWEEKSGSCGMHPPDEQQDAWDGQAAIDQLVALGYVERDENKERAVAQALADRQFNLAQVLLEKGRTEQAAEILEELVAKDPDEVPFLLQLARAHHDLGDFEKCRATANAVIEAARKRRKKLREARKKAMEKAGKEAPPEDPSDPIVGPAEYLLGCVSLGEGKHREALDHLRRAESVDPRLPNLHRLIGRAYLRQRRWRDAERALNKALSIDPDDAAALASLARVHLAQRRHRDAAEAALHSVGLLHYQPQTHCDLGRALIRCGRPKEARLALKTCLAMQPAHRDAQRLLRRLGSPPSDDSQTIAP